MSTDAYDEILERAQKELTIWQGIDADQYVANERDSWDG